MDVMAISGHAIRHLRGGHGWSRFEFARRSGVSVSYLKVIEAGTRQPSKRIAGIIADTLGVDLDAITAPAQSAA